MLFFRNPYNYVLCTHTLWIDFRIWRSSPLVIKGQTFELWLRRENVWGHNTAIFTKLYLIFLTLWFNKVFKLIFTKSSSWPKTMYAEHWRKLAWATFLDNFPILSVQQVFGALMNSCLLEYAIVFPIKIKF